MSRLHSPAAQPHESACRAITGRLVVATHNPGKFRELLELLRPYGVEAVSAAELGLGEPEETGASFRSNARVKAIAATGSGMAALGVSQTVVEKLINHISGGSQSPIAKIYNRYAYLNEMRDAVSRWEAHLEGLLGDDRRVA